MCLMGEYSDYKLLSYWYYLLCAFFRYYFLSAYQQEKLIKAPYDEMLPRQTRETISLNNYGLLNALFGIRHHTYTYVCMYVLIIH